MRSFIIGVVGLIGLATAQSGTLTDLSGSASVQPSTTSSASSDGSSSTTSSPSSSVPSATTLTISSSVSSVTTSATSSVVASSTKPATAVTVALDGSAEFTAINAAVAAAQNRAIGTVSIGAGTYSETVLIQGTQTLTIVGPTASSYTGNQVNIAASAPSGVVAFNTQKSNGIVFLNINITNTISVTNAKAPALILSGSNMLLDTVALISGGIGVYQAGLGTALITNSYVEGSVPEIHNEFRWTLIRLRRRQVVLHIRHGLCLQLRDRPDD